MSRCPPGHQNHANQATRKKKVRSQEKIGPQKTVPEKPGQQNTKAHNKGGGSQRSLDPNITNAVPEKPTQKSKTTQVLGEGIREAREPDKTKVAQRSQHSKAKHTRGGGDPEKPGLLINKSCPREARTEKQKHTRGGEWPIDAGTQKKTKCCTREARTEMQTTQGQELKEAWTLTKQKLSQRSQHRKAKAHKGWEDPEKPGLQNNKSCPREAGTEKQKHIMAGRN